MGAEEYKPFYGGSHTNLVAKKMHPWPRTCKNISHRGGASRASRARHFAKMVWGVAPNRERERCATLALCMSCKAEKLLEASVWSISSV